MGLQPSEVPNQKVAANNTGVPADPGGAADEGVPSGSTRGAIDGAGGDPGDAGGGGRRRRRGVPRVKLTNEDTTLPLFPRCHLRRKKRFFYHSSVLLHRN